MDNTDTDNKENPLPSLLETMQALREWSLRTGDWDAPAWRDFDAHLRRMELMERQNRVFNAYLDDGRCRDPDHATINAERDEARGLREKWTEESRRRQDLERQIRVLEDRIIEERLRSGPPKEKRPPEHPDHAWAYYLHLRDKMLQQGAGKVTTPQDELRGATRPWGLGAGSEFAGSREPSTGTPEPRFRKAVRDSMLDTGFMLAIGAVTALGGYLVGTFDGADAATLWKTVPAIGIAAMGCVFAGFLRGAYRYAGRKN